MKKFITLICAAAMFAGCSRDFSASVAANGEQTVNFTVMTDQAAKAVADLDGNGECIDSCIVEIYINDEGTYKYYKTPELLVVGDATWTFSETFLKNQEYKIIVWAMNKGGYYIYTPEVATVVKDLTKKVNNLDELDAFYAVYPFHATAEQLAASQTIVAKRPFAQLNIITNDVDDRYQPKTVSVSYTAATGIDLLGGETLTGEGTVQSIDVAPYYASTVTGTTRTLSMDYIFVPAADTLVNTIDFDVTVTEKIEYSFTNIPFVRNWRTNIIGNLLTDEAEFFVEIDPIWEGELEVFGGEWAYVTEFDFGGAIAKVYKDKDGNYLGQKLVFRADEGDLIVLEDIGVPYEPIVLPANLADNVTITAYPGVVVPEITIPNDAVINGLSICGFEATRTSSAPLQSGFVSILAGAKVEDLIISDCTITGPGSKTGGAGVWIQSSTNAAPKTVLVQDCEFSGLRYGFYTASALEGATVEFDGCSFENMYSWAIMFNNRNVKGVSISNCTFEGGDLAGDHEGTNAVKIANGTTPADFTFAFVNNTVVKANANITVQAKASQTTISGNTKNGVAWTPSITVLPE